MIWHGKGKEWSEVANVTEAVYKQWLFQSGMRERDLELAISAAPLEIRELSLPDGDRAVVITANGTPVGIPLLWERGGQIPLDDFHSSVILMLFHIATRFHNNAFEEEVNRFGKGIIQKNYT